jgi:hypothetical protein
MADRPGRHLERAVIAAEPFGTWTFSMEPPIVLPGTPVGTRVIVAYTAIRAVGRIEATLRGAVAADWLFVGPDGTATLDMRFCLETADGAVIYVHGGGHVDSAGFASGAAPTWFVPRFETADPRYTWLHRAMVVACGRARGPEVVFELVTLG